MSISDEDKELFRKRQTDNKVSQLRNVFEKKPDNKTSEQPIKKITTPARENVTKQEPPATKLDVQSPGRAVILSSATKPREEGLEPLTKKPKVEEVRAAQNIVSKSGYAAGQRPTS